MGYRLNRLDEPVFMAVPKPMLTEFGIHYRLESCVSLYKTHCKKNCCSFIGLTTLIVGMTINISLRQATGNIDNS